MRTKPARKKKKLSPDELEKEQHRKEIRSVFHQSGIKRISKISDKEIRFGTAHGDIDDIFIHGNVILLAEYTTHKSSNISEHIKKKKIFFDTILSNKNNFIIFLKDKFSTVNDALVGTYLDQLKIIIFYASKYKIDKRHKDVANGTFIFFDYHILKYFSRISNTIRHSARNELLSFFGLKDKDIFPGASQSTIDTYKGSILPEAHSKFKSGFKVVSFYIDPKALLQRAYVLRKDGWRNDSSLYQRMLTTNKIDNIRKYFKHKQRVFVNNIIVTLPPSTKIVDKNGNTIDSTRLTNTAPVEIQLTCESNSIGIIDGQHRVFAYHEGGPFDDEIKELRERLNLLVTG